MLEIIDAGKNLLVYGGTGIAASAVVIYLFRKKRLQSKKQNRNKNDAGFSYISAGILPFLS